MPALPYQQDTCCISMAPPSMHVSCHVLGTPGPVTLHLSTSDTSLPVTILFSCHGVGELEQVTTRIADGKVFVRLIGLPAPTLRLCTSLHSRIQHGGDRFPNSYGHSHGVVLVAAGMQRRRSWAGDIYLREGRGQMARRGRIRHRRLKTPVLPVSITADAMVAALTYDGRISWRVTANNSTVM